MNVSKLARAAFRLHAAAARMAEKCAREVQYRIDEIQIHTNGYAEPGYDGEVVATGNWNKVDGWDWRLKARMSLPGADLPGRLSEALERIGVQIEWSDEWSTCGDCGKLVRTEPDSYSWQASFAMLNECELVCHECMETHAEGYLRELEGDTRRANTIESIDPTDYGYVKLNEESYESGWYPGQTDDPSKVARELTARGIDRFLFGIDSVGQFDTRWSTYVHKSEVSLLSDAPEGDSEGDDA